MVLRSEHFDDVYFSADDGLAETRHVFIEGNGLPGAWQGQERFIICETGFGTGLNFLTVWSLFEETAEPVQRLDFVSFEKYPLSPDQIREALSVWRETLGDKTDRMLAHYPAPFPGFHRIALSDRVTLTLVFDDVNEAMMRLEAEVDCWFLDGFKPASNPEMWSETVFEQMARLSKPGTRFATFTAAGFVKRGLEGAGFTVRKVPGFGRKREMLVGEKT